MTTARERVRLHQLPREAREAFWRGLEDSDYEQHRGCGFVPTGRACPACGKTLGPPLDKPYGYQEDVLNDDHLTVQVAGGEQTGKSTIGARKFESIILAFIGEYKERAAGEVAWIAADSYELTSREYHYCVEAFSRTPILMGKPSERVDPGEIRLKVPGGHFTIKTRSANDAQTLRSESPIVVLACEAATMSQDAYTRLRSRVARSRALFPGYGAIILTSTFEGSVGWYPTIWGEGQNPLSRERDNLASFSLPSFSNIFVYRGGRDDPEIKAMEAELGPDEFSERVLAIPSPPKNRVHATFNPLTHILPEPAEYDPAQPVWVGIDPGYSGQPSHYAIEVFQERFLPCKRKHWWGIDEIHECQLHPEAVIGEAMKRFWWPNPVKTFVIDVAGRKLGTTAGGTLTPDVEIWMKTAGVVPMNQPVDILSGIRRMDALLNRCADPNCGEPVLAFSPTMRGIIAEMGGGPHPHDRATHVYQWATGHDGTLTGRVPRDAWNDGVKAATYLFIAMIGFTLGGTARQRIRVKRMRSRERARVS